VDGVFHLVLLAAGVAVAWYALQPRYHFLLRIDAGRVRLTRGKVTDAFLADVGEVCRDLGVTAGWVGGVRRGRRVVLAFSWRLTPAFRQRLRNLWTLHG
jgi:hypothetical protein